MTQITFTSIINTALLKANNRDNLKSYLIRQSKIANRDAFYELEDFSQGLIKVATGKIGYIKHSHDVYLKHVQTQIDNIETLSFKDPSRVKDSTDYTNEERAQFQETERAKYLKWAKHELKNSKLNDYNKNEYGRLETIIDVVNEINNNNNNVITDKPKKQGRPKAIIQDASYYLINEKLLLFLKSKYSVIKPQFFNHLIRVLQDLNQLKPATKKEYKEAFGEALNVEQTQTNFDNSFNIDTNTTIYEPIKKEIMNFLDDNNM